MPDNATFDTVDLNGGGGDPQQLAAWITGAASRVAQGLPLDHSGQWDPAHGRFSIPAGYGIENGRLVQDTQTWSSIYKGLLGVAGMATLGMLIGPTLAAGSGAAGAGVGAAGGGVATTAAGASTVSSAVAPTIAAGTGIPAAFGNTAVDTVNSAAPSASSVPSWLRTAIGAGAPLAIRAATSGGGSNGSGANGLDAEQNDLLTQLIKMSMTRQQESAPIHQAAMALAGKLAPSGSWGDSPRFNDAVAQTGGPGPAPIVNPTIAAAYAKLMGGR